MRPTTPGHVAALFLLLFSATVLPVAGVPPGSVVRIFGGPGTYELRINGRPFTVRGISFTANEGVEDPSETLTKVRLRYHFRRIREAGANTIRRYGETPDSPAILDEAWWSGLMVLMGYWLDQDADYLKDQRRLALYRQRVRDWVIRYRRHPAVLMWVLGNETWGLLKLEYPNPVDLWPRRIAYYRFVNELAQMIKILDPYHPVMTVDEHAPDMATEYPGGHLGIEASLRMFRDEAPAVDVFGVNSYFPQDIGVLSHLVRKADIRRPYLVTEFGPPGYWLPHRIVDDLGQPIEPTDLQKAMAYAWNWGEHIEAHRGWNLGGNAFAWKDKHEGTFTWFGLTDSQDRLKPAYWMLREVWTGRRRPPDAPLVVAFSINKRWMRPEESFVVRTRLAEGPDPELYRFTYLIAPVTLTHIAMQFTTDLPQVSLQAPGVPGLYRVYVYATNRANTWVSTGSATFGVYEPRRRP